MKQSLINTVSGRQQDAPWYPVSDMTSSSSASFSDLSNTAKGYTRQDDEVGVVSGEPSKRQCTSREAALVAAVLALLLLAAVLIALVATFSDPCRHQAGPGCDPKNPKASAVKSPDETLCLSASCVGIASRVVSSIDHEASACSEFYQYACGRFGEGNPLPVTSGVVDAYRVISKVNQQRVREVLETPGLTVKGVESAAVRNAKTYYKSCLNVHVSDKMGREAALQLIRDLGSWPLTSDPVSGSFDPTKFDLEDRLARAFQLRAFPLLLLEVEPDLFSSRAGPNILQFGPGSLGLQSMAEMTKPNSEHEHDVFVTFFTSVTSSLGADPRTAAEVAEQVWRLNEAVARITPANILSNLDRPTIAEFSAGLQQHLDVGRLLRLTFGSDMPETERVLVLGKDYFTYLSRLLGQADKGLLAIYITWHTLVTMAPYLGATIRHAEEQAQVDLYDYAFHPPPRWEMCVQRTTDLFPSVVDALYVDTFSSGRAKKEGEAMVGFILEELLKQLPAVPWMDNQTVEEAEDKLEALTHRVGYSTLVTDAARLDQAWAHIGVLRADDELFNLRLLRTADYRKSFRDRRHAGNTTWWDKTATETLGAYDRFQNQMVFTAGILQYPFYEADFPRSMKLGALGTAMGEEAVHVLDAQGRYYDAGGAYRDWWSPLVVEAYSNTTRCFRKHPIGTGPQVDLLDLEEKLVADSGALKLAYRVYEDFVTQRGGTQMHPVLPAVNLTETQLFFLSYAQRFCVKDHGLPSAGGGTAEDANRHRVLRSLQNSEDFAAAFQCPTGSPMNPQDKCSIW